MTRNFLGKMIRSEQSSPSTSTSTSSISPLVQHVRNEDEELAPESESRVAADEGIGELSPESTVCSERSKIGGSRSRPHNRTERRSHPYRDQHHEFQYRATRSLNPWEPHKLWLLTSDGSDNTWPSGSKVAEYSSAREDREEDYFERLYPAHETHQRWLSELGNWLAGMLKIKRNKKEEWTLVDLPQGYGLFHHHSLGVATTGKERRTDAYLYGSVNTNVPRFRSPNEALRHFYWLASGRLDRPSCKCKYCGPEQRQRKLNAGLVEEVGEPNLAPSSRCPSVIDPLDQARRSIALQSTPRSLPSAPRGNVLVGSSELRRQRSEQTRGPSLWEVVEQTATH